MITSMNIYELFLIGKSLETIVLYNLILNPVPRTTSYLIRIPTQLTFNVKSQVENKLGRKDRSGVDHYYNAFSRAVNVDRRDRASMYIQKAADALGTSRSSP